MSEPRRHIYVPDTQVRKGVPIDHLPWIGQYIVEMKPDVTVLAGDWFDFPSLSSHSAPGSLEKENARYADDLKAGNDALEAFMAPIHEEQARLARNKKKAWKHEIHVTLGNHSARVKRYIDANPVLEGTIGYQDCEFEKHGIIVHDFLKPVVLDGVAYCHYFPAQNTGRAMGGSAANILAKLGHSFTQGHRQVFDYAVKNSQITGHELIGLIAGACYVHAEGYLSHQGNSHFRGIIVKNEIRNGHYDIMRVSLDYLCRHATGKRLRQYLADKYPEQGWEHIEE